MSIGGSKYTVPFSLGAVITDADAEGSDAIAEIMLMPNGVIPKGVARRELMLMPKGVPRGVTDAEGSDAEGSDNLLAVTKQYMYNRYPCCCQ